MIYVNTRTSPSSPPLVLNAKVEWFLFGDCEIEIVFRQQFMPQSVRQPLISFGWESESVYTNNLYDISLVPRSSTLSSVRVGNEYGGGSENYFADQEASISLNTWCRVKMIRSGATYKVYVDGVLKIDASFPSSALPTSFANPQINGSQRMILGGGYFDNSVYLMNYDVNIAYVNIKNQSGTSVFTSGEDPGNNSIPRFGGIMALDPYNTVQPRAANKSKGAPIESAMYAKPRSTMTTAKGIMFDEKEISGFKRPLPKPGLLDYDPLKITGKVKPRGGIIEDSFYKTFIRGNQRGNAYILEMTGSGKNGGEAKEAIPPRAFPLESPWKKANPTSFNK